MSVMKVVNYQDVRKEMMPGDVLAFSGKGNVSDIIKAFTRSTVSHVGVVLQTTAKDDETDRFFNQIIESTSINGYSGVVISRLSQRLSNYDGDVWWLPLREHKDEYSFDTKKFFDFLFAQEGKPYDTRQAIKSAIDILDSLHGPGYSKEDFNKFFCSELVAASLEAAGFVPKVNASEVTPIDLCRWKIYKDKYYMLKGDPSVEISGFNTRNPGDWNI